MLQSEAFLEWKSSIVYEGSPLCLWINGGPGFGKTILSARIVEYLRETSALPLAFFFCRHEDELKKKPISILASFIDQLASQWTEAFNIVEQKSQGKERRRPTEIDLWEIFLEILSALPGCRFVVDGFDECSDIEPAQRYFFSGYRASFLEHLLQHITSSGSKLLLVSRNEADIRTVLAGDHYNRSAPSVHEYAMSVHDTGADVERLARVIIDKRHVRKTEQERDTLTQRLASKAAGMFLWVRLENDRLRPSMSMKQLENVLGQMPSGIHLLDHSFERSLNSIAHMQEEDDRNRAAGILRWVIYATRPLTTKELLKGVATDINCELLDVEQASGAIDELLIDDWILRVCASLIEIRTTEGKPPEDWTIHLTHFSVKEYLTKRKFATDHFFYNLSDERYNQDRLAQTCVSYLTSDCTLLHPVRPIGKTDASCTVRTFQWQDIPEFKGKLSRQPFLGYALTNWLDHYKSGSRSNPKLLKAVIDFFFSKDFQESQKLWRQIYHIMSSLDTYETPNGWLDRYLTQGSNNGFYYLALEGLHEVVETQIHQEKALILLPGGEFGNPLQAAAARGCIQVMRLLIDRAGVDVNIDGGKLGSPLQAAAYGGHEETVSVLLQLKATVNTSNGKYGSPLQAACAGGREAVVNRLLLAGAAVNAEGGEHGNALVAAADNGHENIVKTLLQAGAATSWSAGSVPWSVPFWQ
jgi:hypothetical protein